MDQDRIAKAVAGINEMAEEELGPRKRGRKNTQRRPKRILCACGVVLDDPVDYRNHKRAQENPDAHTFTLVDDTAN